MYDDPISSHRFCAQDLHHSSDSETLHYLMKPNQMTEEEEHRQLITPSQVAQITNPSSTAPDLANQFEAAHHSFPTWLLCSFFELAIALPLWIAGMASFFAAKFIRMIGLHPPFFFPRWTSNWLGHQGSLLCDHVSEELCMLSQSILHRDVKANTTPCTSPSFKQNNPPFSPLRWVKPERARLGVPTFFQAEFCPCCEHPRVVDGLNLRSSDDTPRVKTMVHHKAGAGSRYCMNCSASFSRGLFHEELMKKHSYDTVSLPSDSCEVSDDNSNANASQSDYEQSLEVFPEELTDSIPSNEEESTSGGQVQLVSGYKMQPEIQYEAMVMEMVTDPDIFLQGPDSNHHNANGNIREALMLDTEALDQVYLELEKERTAAATAAGEAMAMIAKLQQDKAALQMEAVQYQRMAEERAQCDKEAISVLRDLLVRQEEERAWLEREVEQYRAKLLHQEGNEPGKEGVVNDAIAWPCVPNDFEDSASMHEVELTKSDDTLQGQQFNQLDMVHGLQSNESDPVEMKLGGGAPADRCWQHVLERICKLEEQIHSVRGKHIDCPVFAGVSGAKVDGSTSREQRST